MKNCGTGALFDECNPSSALHHEEHEEHEEKQLKLHELHVLHGESPWFWYLHGEKRVYLRTTGYTPWESALVEHEEGFSLVAFTAGTARDNGQKIARDPIEDEPAHGVVVGKKTRSIKRKR